MSSEAERRQSHGITAIPPPSRGREQAISDSAPPPPLQDPVAAASGGSAAQNVSSTNLFAKSTAPTTASKPNSWDSTFAWSQMEEGARKYEAYKYQEPGFCEKHKRLIIIGGIIAIGLAIGLGVGLTNNNDDNDSASSLFAFGLTSSKLFVMTNAQDGNEVVMYEQNGSNGMLSQVGCFPTGGIGGALGGAQAGEVAPPDDPLASEDSLIVAGDNCLLAVNAGSNTVTSFTVENHGLANMGSHDTQGTYPVSVAEYNGMVYVMNAGGDGSLVGFNLQEDCSLEPTGADPISLEQAGPLDPPFFVASPAQVSFTPDGSFLVVSIKGISGAVGPGTIRLYPVQPGEGLGTPEITTTNGFTPFTFAFDNDGNLVIVEAFGTATEIPTLNAGAVSLYTIEESGSLTVSETSESVPTGQTTTCWMYHYDGCLLTTNNGGNSISSLSVSNGELTLLNEGSEPQLNAPIDGAFSGDGAYFYVLSTGHTLPDTDPNQGHPGIYVYSVEDCGLTQIQTIADGLPTEFETVFGAVGMAFLAVQGGSDASSVGGGGGPTSPPPPPPPGPAPGPGTSNNLFVMTNAESGNEVVYYVSDADSGMLSRIGSFATGGIGAALGAEAPPDLAPPDDPLASQGSVIVAGEDCLLAVNAGSDTVTSFTVQSHGLQSHGSVPSGGDLPVSLAENNGVVYVMNAGGTGSISGFNLDASCVLTPIPGSTVSLGQTGTNDPPFFVASPAQISFTPDGQFLVVSIKGINGTPGPGTISLYPVSGPSGLLGTPQVTTTNGNTPFSFEFDNDGHLIIVEAFGTASTIPTLEAGAVSLYTVESDGALTVSPTSESIPTGQTTTCWIYHYEGCLVTTNNGGNSISALSVSEGELSLLNGGTEPQLNAPIDGSFSSDGRYFYAISTGHTIAAGAPGQGQPVIYAYSVSDCSLDSIQTISDGLPSEFTTIFGVVGMAVMERIAGPFVPSQSNSLFTMTNAQLGNEVVMYNRDVTTGLLSFIGSFPTGGIGAALGGEAAPDLAPPDDPLASQDSLIVTGNCLIAVNAGSDTVTSFSIEDFGLQSHGMQSSGGSLPVSIAESNGVVYVMNAGGAGSISGFNLDSNCVLSPIAGSTTTLGQTGTANPPFFVASPAQVGFTPDGDFLVVSIKGINGTPGPGTISLYPVGADGALGTPQITTTNGSTPFTFEFDNDGNLIIVEAFGTAPDIPTLNAGAVSLYAVETSGALTVSTTSESVPTNQTTTCWLYHYEGCLLTTNNGGNSISALSVSGGELALLNGGSEPQLNAPIDGAFSNDGAFFYVLSTGHTLPDDDTNQGQPGIYVYSVTDCSPTEIQTISDGIPSELVTVFGAVGLAVF